MHYVGGALLVAQFALVWVAEASLDFPGLEYAAWAVWLVAVVLLGLSIRTLSSQGRVGEGRTCVQTEALVASGIYRLIRHPLYLGWMLMYIAMFLFRPNGTVAAAGLAGLGCVYGFTRREERRLLVKFGQAYGRYMQAVPRFNLVSGAIRLLAERGGEDVSRA
jgi:protein-S-isoprenylcysteine O-methyltransferase Ste14